MHDITLNKSRKNPNNNQNARSGVAQPTNIPSPGQIILSPGKRNLRGDRAVLRTENRRAGCQDRAWDRDQMRDAELGAGLAFRPRSHGRDWRGRLGGQILSN
jgi:hypothetical protein